MATETTEHERAMQHIGKQQAAATLAAAMISLHSKPLQVAEVMAIYHNAFFILHPEQGHGRYLAWKKQVDAGEI